MASLRKLFPHVDPLSTSWYATDAAIGVVAHWLGDDAAAVAGAVRQTSVVGEEKPLVLKLNDGGVGGV